MSRSPRSIGAFEMAARARRAWVRLYSGTAQTDRYVNAADVNEDMLFQAGIRAASEAAKELGRLGYQPERVEPRTRWVAREAVRARAAR